MIGSRSLRTGRSDHAEDADGGCDGGRASRWRRPVARDAWKLGSHTARGRKRPRSRASTRRGGTRTRTTTRGSTRGSRTTTTATARTRTGWRAAGTPTYKNCGPTACPYGLRPLRLPAAAGRRRTNRRHRTEGRRRTNTTTRPRSRRRVTITLPADAKLLFNGAVATGTGETRTFATPALEHGPGLRLRLDRRGDPRRPRADHHRARRRPGRRDRAA